MTTTGHIYDPVTGAHVARIENDTEVIDTTTCEGGKIATVRDGNLYDLQGKLLGHLTVPDGNGDPAPEAFKTLLKGGKQ